MKEKIKKLFSSESFSVPVVALVTSVLAYFAHSSNPSVCAVPFFTFLLTAIYFFFDQRNTALISAFLSSLVFALFLGDELKYALVFTLAYFLIALFSFCSASFVRKALSVKKYLLCLLSVLFLALGVTVQFLYSGSPLRLPEVRKMTEDYLSEQYLNVSFTEFTPRFDPLRNEYYCEAGFDYDGNMLYTRIAFSSENDIADYFHDSLTTVVSDKLRASVIPDIRALTDESLSVTVPLVDILNEEGKVEAFFGMEDVSAYVSEATLSVTFGTPMTKKRDFAEHIDGIYPAIKEKGFEKCVFYCTDASFEPLFVCEITPSDEGKDTLSLCRLVSE